MFDCKLCSEACYTSYICVSCNRIKDMVNLYSRNVVISVLDECLVRNEIKRKYKIDKIKNSNDIKICTEKEKVKTENKDIKNHENLNKRCLKELKRKLDDIKEV